MPKKGTGLFAAGISALLLLTACGGGGEAPNVAPIANAGPAQIVNVGATVTLNGAASSDTDGAIASYAWTQTAGPTVALNNASSAQPSFVAPQSTAAATFTFRLFVTDNIGATSGMSTVTITVNGNAVPVANAGPPQTVPAGALVFLSGAASSDDGPNASYAWAQTSGAPVTLNNPAQVSASFVAPVGAVASTLTFRLIVTDNRGVASAEATATVNVNANVAPIANAGPPQAVQAGAAVTLNGSASVDPEVGVLSYAWTQTAGTAVTLNNASSATPGFTAPVALVNSTLTFRLIVTDNGGASSTASTVTITVFQNFVPAANAGAAQTVAVGASVTLNGSASFDAGGGFIASYAWTQTSGPAVVLTGASNAQPSFTAPGTPSTLVFSLVVTDNLGATSSPSTVTINVNATVTISGVVRFQRVPFLAGAPFGLDYANPILQPARGITVNATLTGGSVVATTVTDSSGNYSLTLPANLSVNIRLVAQMVRDNSQPLPRWNMRVQDGSTINSTCVYFNGVVNSSVGTHNVDIPSAISAGGVTNMAPCVSSRPFAILDTIYTAMQTVLSVAPNTSFPDLYVDWGGQTEGTFFTTQNGQHIALMSNLGQDTDEFDQHVVAHEFGHYLEENFSRSDSVGGSHALGQKLDMRVAFGEGFGYAFAAIVLNDPVARDSYVSGGMGGTQSASTFNIETNPAGSAGCWCSETSVWSILWDLYDSPPDGNDNISLPFSAIWDVLVNQQRFTPSVTSIFSFTTALKTAQPASAGLIDNLVSAQNTNPFTIDAFATSETFLPFPGMSLPLFANITRGGGPVTVRSIDDGGHFNKAGNRSFLRFTAATSGSVTVSATTTNVAATRDPDFVVWNNGTLFRVGDEGSAEFPETETFSVTAGQTYIIDAYDCANGCSTDQGTPGDYDLTVTIN